MTSRAPCLPDAAAIAPPPPPPPPAIAVKAAGIHHARRSYAVISKVLKK